MKFDVNVGKIDQYVRYLLGLVFLVLSFLVNPWFFIGTVIMFVTAYFKFCPIYRIFGIKTSKLTDTRDEQK